MSSDNINTVGNVSGSNIRIEQIYAPGAGRLEVEVFSRSEDAEAFSGEWLIFSQESVPFIGREREFDALRNFVTAPYGFAWWAITGQGGYGKSRLGLEFLKNLPDGWSGGFLRARDATGPGAAAWQPTGNTLWIIDDAAVAATELGAVIAFWASRHDAGPHKVRLLLLERGHSDTIGWWAELTQGLSPHLGAIKRTLYQRPLELVPLAGIARPFLANLCEELDDARGESLRAIIAQESDDKILEDSQGGNPLLLMLLAAELQSEGAGAATRHDGKATLAERHFMRELDLLKLRCDASGLRLNIMLDLLFLTSSCFPIKLLLGNDTLLVHAGKEVMLEKGDDGLYRIPTVTTLRKLGVDVDRQNRPYLDALNTILEIDDVEAYLSVLSEIGLDPRRFAIQPDLITAVLCDLILNSPATATNLKRRRGEFDADRARRLISGAYTIAPKEACSTWARLSDRTLSQLVWLARESGRSIRYSMLLARSINQRRSTLIPLDIHRQFAASVVHPETHDVGRYLATLRETIAIRPTERAVIAALSASPHVWVAPYCDSLFTLTVPEKLRLGLVICGASHGVVLSRLTNLANFVTSLHDALAHAMARRVENLACDDEIAATGDLVDAVFDFAATRAWPEIVRAGDRGYKSLYSSLARVLATASFIVANSRRGREETATTRGIARAGLEIARLALAIAPSQTDLEFVERNDAVLRSHDMDDPLEAARLYEATLSAMAQFASAGAYTAALEDLLYLSETRAAPQILETLLSFLRNAPPHLVEGERLVWRVVNPLADLAESGEAEQVELGAKLAAPFFRYFAGQMRASEDGEAALAVVQLAKIMANLIRGQAEQNAAINVFCELNASFEEAPPSDLMMRAVLEGAQATHIMLRFYDAPAADKMPFGMDEISFSQADLMTLIRSEAERAVLAPLTAMTVVVTHHKLGDRPHIFTGFQMHYTDKTAAEAGAALYPLSQILFHRFLVQQAPEGLTGPGS